MACLPSVLASIKQVRGSLPRLLGGHTHTFISLIDYFFCVDGWEHLTSEVDQEYFCSLGLVTPSRNVPLHGGISLCRHGWGFASGSLSSELRLSWNIHSFLVHLCCFLIAL